jgi:hypothetical protein
MQLRKCSVYGHDTAAAEVAAQELGISHAKVGLMACGTPLGTPAFITPFLAAQTKRTCCLIDPLLALPHAALDQCLVLCISLQPHMDHLMHTVSWTLLDPLEQPAGSTPNKVDKEFQEDAPDQKAALCCCDPLTKVALVHTNLVVPSHIRPNEKLTCFIESRLCAKKAWKEVFVDQFSAFIFSDKNSCSLEGNFNP